MLKKTITFNDLDGNPLTEDFFFHLSQHELAEMELSIEGGLAKRLRMIIGSNNRKEILDTFKSIVLASVGERSEDGRRFIKTDKYAAEFSQTEAFSKLFMELLTDPKASAEFMRSVVPDSVAKNLPPTFGNISDIVPQMNDAPKEKTYKDYTTAELIEMSSEDFAALAGTDPQTMDRNLLAIAYSRKMQNKD